MALTAGTNNYTKAEDSLISLVAKSADARTFLGAADETAARARIYVDEVPRASEDVDDFDEAAYASLFPCVIISAPEDGAFFETKQDSRDAVINYLQDWMFAVRFERLANPALDEQNQLREFKNLVFNALEEMLETTVGEPDVFLPTSVAPLDGVYRLDFRHRQNLGHMLGISFLFKIEIQ